MGTASTVELSALTWGAAGLLMINSYWCTPLEVGVPAAGDYTDMALAAVIVHGGAYAVPDSIAEASIAGCRTAVDKACKILKSGKSALDAGRY